MRARKFGVPESERRATRFPVPESCVFGLGLVRKKGTTGRVEPSSFSSSAREVICSRWFGKTEAFGVAPYEAFKKKGGRGRPSIVLELLRLETSSVRFPPRRSMERRGEAQC